MPGVGDKESKENEDEILQPRQPTSLQGLLKFSMEATKNEDAPGLSQVQPMDPERRHFLEEAIKSMTVDVIELLQKQIKTLQAVESLRESEDVTPYQEAILTILDYVDQIDTANDFHKIGGFMILKPCLKSKHAKIRAGGCNIIAELCQNNPYCQKVVVDNEFIPLLLHILETDPDTQVALKCLYAISAIVRDYFDGFSQLLHYEGLSVLLKALKREDDDKFRIKTAFLLSSLCRCQPDLKRRIIFLNYIPTLIELISQERKPSHEYLISFLTSLLEDNPSAANDCKNAHPDFKGTLLNYVESIKDKEEYLEEKENCKRLLHLIYGV